MKLRWLAGALALAFGAAPWMVAQTPGQDPQNQPGTQTPQTQTPQTQNPPSQSPQKAPPTTDPDDGQPKASDIQNAPKKAPAALPVQEDSQIKHDGGKTDVDAVGNRNVGCGRGVGNWYSVEKQVAMGRSFAQQVESQVKMVNDPVVTEYVNRIGQNIVKNSDCKVPFTIKVIDTDEINAMALPGGFFYVNSGLILAADEEAELAGVMAHETAHVCAHHAAREMTRANYAQIGMVPLIMMTGYSWTGYGIYEATQLMIPITFLEFSREFEAQADYLGVQYMYRAGYDPQAFVTFFEKIENLEKTKPGAVARVFENHPQTPDRIQHTEEEIASILPPKDQYLVTTSEFNDVKARLARIENKRRITDKQKGKPSLRRVSSNGSPDGTDSTSGSDQPTLHRRDDSGSGSSGSGSGSGSGGNN